LQNKSKLLTGKTETMIKHTISIVAFMVISFGVQGTAHFAINKAYYAGIDFARPEPIIPLGLLAMIIQGIILTFALERISAEAPSLMSGLTVSLAFGIFLASYIALAEPAKYMAPSVSSWMINEGLTSLIQFTLVGLALGFIHQRLA